MSGFVGSRAKKRRRNIFLTIGILIILGIFIYLVTSLETVDNDIIPNDNIIPNPIEDLTSLVSDIEELELTLFQKDQKIKFRDGQIINLQKELKNIQFDYKAIILELNDYKNASNSKVLVSSNKHKILQEDFTKLNTKNDKQNSTILKLNKQIDNLNKNLLLIDEQNGNLIFENQKLKKDTKSYFAQNLKLNNMISDLKNEINNQKIEIDLQLEQLKELKDKSHHGG